MLNDTNFFKLTAGIVIGFLSIFFLWAYFFKLAQGFVMQGELKTKSESFIIETNVDGSIKEILVKVGELVEQGQVIGSVGMTGYTSGPHVCYRFWKNGRQVDPFKQKLPEAKPISNKLKTTYLNDIVNLKTQLDCISFNSKSTYINSALAQSNSDIQ